ncbi:hypothetical protein BS78_04G282500 [Paspalum vaginatum]|nr:hypothetical protein BS78_04G282500 [Paspalum vaginatum]
MYSCEQDHTAAAPTTMFDTRYQPSLSGRSLQLSAHHPPGQQVLRTAARSAPVAAGALQTRRAKNKKHGASRPSSSSRRSSTTVVATDVNNFRSMVQELTSFPPAAIFRPLPRRVHAANHFAAIDVAAGQGCGAEQHGRYGGSESTMVTNSTAAAAAAGGISPVGPSALPVAVMAQQPPGVFDWESDIWSPEFDSWEDLSVESLDG